MAVTVVGSSVFQQKLTVNIKNVVGICLFIYYILLILRWIK